MRHSLVRSAFAFAIASAAAAVFVSNVEGEASHAPAFREAALRSPADASPVQQISGTTGADEAKPADTSPPAPYVVGGSTETSVMVTEAQKAAIRRAIALLDASNLSRSSLQGSELAIGARLPREKVRIARLPSQVLKIAPNYGAYEYFLTESGSLVIVDPGSYEIVDLIGA